MKNAGKDAERSTECISYQVFCKKQPDSTKSPIMTLLSMKAGQFPELQNQIKNGTLEEDVLLLNFQDGEYSELAIPMITEAFLELLPALVYGDEDVIVAGKRQNPWLKPDWSPDTFLSCFYFGAFVAVPTAKIAEFLQKRSVSEGAEREVEADLLADGGPESELQQGKQEDQVLYELLADYLRENGAFTGWKTAGHVVVHIPQVLMHTEVSSYERWKNLHLTADITADIQVPTVSVIIPSKDHPDILFRCLDSFVDKTSGLGTKVKTEFIIVDNGSSEENKNRIEQKLQKINNTRYIYKELPFNFSYMCNWGAKEAQGDYLLFLNDDMEIVDADWLILLMEKAVLPYVGAVGAKLLYPDTDIIQHAGITNLRVGPAHKLQFAHDKEDHYFGQNRGVHDMLGVTGACLLVRKTLFEKVGGFDETLAVAFNDVDLCYKIYEEGYYNVVRNDLFLFHHESLSRGKDGESEEKQLRLLREKDYLYEKHQDLYGKDPFYHPYLTTDMLETEYTPAFRYQVDLLMPWAKVKECTQEVLAAREDGCLVIGMECAMDIYKWKYGVSPEKRKAGNSDK